MTKKIEVTTQEVRLTGVNLDFKPVEFDGFKKLAGLNSFTLTPKQWTERTGAIGIQSIFSPNGALHASPGHRPGYGHPIHRTPTGWPKTTTRTPQFGSPLQGSGCLVTGDPGRCPGLARVRPLACGNGELDAVRAEVSGYIWGLLV